MPENDIEVFVVVPEPPLPSGQGEGGFDDEAEHEQHAALVGRGRLEAAIDPAEFEKRWGDIVKLVNAMFKEDKSERGDDGLQLDSIEAALAVTAKGGLAFIAEASASASITATFKRPKEDV